MVEQMAPNYKLTNLLYRNNCTLTALFPAVVSIKRLIVGGTSNDVNYDVSIYVHKRLGRFFLNYILHQFWIKCIVVESVNLDIDRLIAWL